MQSYHDNLILQFDDQATGNAASGQLVTVFDAGLATKPAIFDVLGSPIANPLTTDIKGNFSFTITDGVYDIVGRAGTPDETRRDQVQIAVPSAAIIPRLNPETLAIAIADPTLEVDDVLHVKVHSTGNGGGAIWDVVLESTVTTNGIDIVVSTGDATLALVLRVKNIARIASFGGVPGVDIAAQVRRAQTRLVANGGGKILIDINGASTMVDGLTVDPTFADFVIDVESGIEITAIPEFTMLGDKTQGGDIAGYCAFHIFEDKKDIKIHGFKDIDGGDKTTNKGLGQVVAIRGETGVTRATNIDIWDITAKEIRDEPFRLGQTAFAGQIGENVNIWDIRVDGCTSHGVVMRSMLNSKASGLNIKNAGRLGIDISSHCVNCHLDGGKGVNTFFNTVGGAKVDGASNNINCSIGDYTYDGDTLGAGSVDGYTFRLMGKGAKASNIKGKNCGGSGINMLSGGAADNDMDMELENIEIDIVTNGDGSSATFNGKPLLIKHNSAGDLGVKMRNVQISNAVSSGIIDANKVHGELKLVNNSVVTLNDNAAGQSKNLHLHLSIVDSIYNVVKDGTNGGSDDVNFFIHEFEGESELDIENSTKVVVTGDAPINSTKVRQIRFDDCPDFQISNLTGSGQTMVWIAGTVASGLVEGLTGDYSDGIVFESGGLTYTDNKGLYANILNKGAGGLVLTGSGVDIENFNGISAPSYRVFANADATPSVKNGRKFQTTGGTEITTFNDGIDGQEITVRASAAITVVGVAMVTNDFVQFEFFGSVWFPVNL